MKHPMPAGPQVSSETTNVRNAGFALIVFAIGFLCGYFATRPYDMYSSATPDTSSLSRPDHSELADCRSVRERRLHEVFPELRPYDASGENVVDKSYVKSFRVSGSQVTIKLGTKPDAIGEVRPDFRLLFFDEYGVPTGEVTVLWLLDRIQLATTTVIEERITPRGQRALPYYWMLRFNQ